MTDPAKAYWYNRTQRFIETKAADPTLPEEIKEKITSQYDKLTPENAKSVLQEVTQIQCAYDNKVAHDESVARNKVAHDIDKSLLKDAARVILIGGTVGLLSSVVLRRAPQASRLHKWATRSQFCGFGFAGLGVAMALAIGH